MIAKKKMIRAVPYTILIGGAIVGILFPDFMREYEIPLIVILCPLGVLAYLKGEEVI